MEPIVLDLPDRGLCAIDYIDYFDEGLYGPDKPYFVARFKKLSDIAAQMDKCLALQTTKGSLIHFNRHHIPDKYIEPLKNPEEEYPQRAQYCIRFMLRFRFYGDFAYLDIGKKWEEGDIEAAVAGTLKVTPDQLTVVNKCWLSDKDAESILNLIKGTNEGDKLAYTLSYSGQEKYVPESSQLAKLSDDEIEEMHSKELEAAAIFLTDGESVLGDAEGALNIA